ncbi:unnamed protein product [Adineta ricciae]|uniref:Uncharacterized protein n=2 Tax=Adineta ricciae TaxID=249248 RepID=A0A815M5M3_ADIRI|nr:unnamed protein product [Adineta ricciae]
MRLFWILLLFFYIFSNVHALMCINFDKEEYVSMIDFDRYEFEQLVGQFDMVGNQSECRIKIIAGHADQTIILQFSKILQSERMSPGIVYFNTEIIYKNKDSIEYVHELSTVCSGVDGCDKRFIFEHVDWLLQTQYEEFFKITVRLLQGGDDDLQKCIQCASGFCAAYWSSSNESYTARACNREPKAMMHLMNDFNMRNYEKTRSVYFFCGYNYCHVDSSTRKLRIAIKDHYDLSPLWKVLSAQTESTTTSAVNFTLPKYSTKLTTTIITTSAKPTASDYVIRTETVSSSSSNESNNGITWQSENTIIMTSFNAMIILYSKFVL